MVMLSLMGLTSFILIDASRYPRLSSRFMQMLVRYFQMQSDHLLNTAA